MWSTPPEHLVLEPGCLHLWRASLDLPGARQGHLDGVLTPEERTRCGRFVRATDRDRCAAARASLRLVLAKYVATDPRSLRISPEASGKPFLASSDIQFNMSHSDDLAVVAVSRGRRIGVDIERIRDIRDMDAVLDGFFSDEERSFLSSRPPQERKRAFFLFWTRREAAAKAIGLGIYEAFGRIVLPLFGPRTSGFEVELPPEPAVPGRSTNWWMRDLSPAPGFAGALCAEDTNAEPSLFRLQA